VLSALGGILREFGARGPRGPEAAADVEIVDGSQRVVDRRGLALENGPQVAAVVADRPVARIPRIQRITGAVRVGESREELSDLRSVRVSRLLSQRRGSQRGGVLLETAVKGSARPTAARPRRGRAIPVG
jgi:hypothetical protein